MPAAKRPSRAKCWARCASRSTLLAGGHLAAQVGEGLLERGALVRGLGPEPCGMRVQERLGVFAARNVLDGEQDELEVIDAKRIEQHRPVAELREGCGSLQSHCKRVRWGKMSSSKVRSSGIAHWPLPKS